MNRLSYWIATCCLIGQIPFAPGTWGSASAFLFIPWLENDPLVYFFVMVVLIAVGVWSSELAARALRQSDPSCIVIDELCGMFVTFCLIPFNFKTAVAGFSLFRIFDIWKPFPIRWFERMPGGYGIVGDDLIAGLFANLILHGLVRYGFM